jgi:anti-anti-sigma factor
MITTPSTFLDSSRRQLVRTFALGIIILTSLFGIVVLVFLILTPSFGLAMLLVPVACNVIASSVAVVLLNRRPLWQPVLLLTTMMSIGVVAATLLFSESKASIVPVFLVGILLVGMIGNPRMTIGAVTVYALLVVGIMATPSLPGFTISLGPLLPVIQVVTPIAVFVLVWIITDRQTAALTSAICLISERAIEAAAARAEAETARAEVEQRNTEQARLLELVQTLELPVIPIDKHVLVMPLVGSLDSRRVEAIQRRLLEAVAQSRAHTVVLDVTGISMLDTSVARQLLLTAQAVRLLGARTLLSGISATVAQTLVTLGVVLDDLQAVSDLGQALEVVRQS